MAKRGLLRVFDRPTHYAIYRRKIKIGVINKKGLVHLFGEGFDPLKAVSEKWVTRKVENRFRGDALIRGIQFAKAYNKARIKFFKNKEFTPYGKDSPEFEHFVKAAELTKRHKTTYAKFIQAQIAGLKFVGGGKGTFPTPKQLASEQAETRVAEYARKDLNEKGEELEIVLSWKEKTESLSNNSKYQTLRRKVQNAEATMYEALYVRKCQMIRRGEVEEIVDDYIDFLKDEAKKSKKKR